MKILRFVAGALLVMVFFIFPSCNKSSSTAILGNWHKRSPFGGNPRAGTATFTVGNKAFVGGGFEGGGNKLEYENDWWFYDVEKQYWDTIARFPGEPREQAVAFSINGKGYVGTGYNRDSVVYQLRDFWEYDPATYKWKQLKDFGGEPRFNAVAFSDGHYGYLGTGQGVNYYGDFWQYDPDNDSWKKIPSYGGNKRAQATTVNIGTKTYLFGGQNNLSFTQDIWEFDATLLPGNPWTERTPLTTDAQYNNFRAAVNRLDAVAFSMGNVGYITTGGTPGAVVTTWVYDPSVQTYTQMTSFEGAARTQAVAFVLGETTKHAFVATGLQSTFYFDDMMEFNPTEVYVQND